MGKDYTKFSNQKTDVTIEEKQVVVEAPEVIIEEPKTPEPELKPGFVSNCLNLNVRVEPDSLSDVVTTLKRGTEILISEEESTDEFCKIYTATGAEGFCMRNFVKEK